MVTQNLLCTYSGKEVFLEKKNRFVMALKLINCLHQITEITPYCTYF